MKHNKGFTLIELLVVIAIIGILSGIVITAVMGAREKASDETIRTELVNLRTAAELYWIDHQSYGTAMDACSIVGSMFQTKPVEPYIDSLIQRTSSLGVSYPIVCNAADQKYAVAVVMPSTVSDSTPTYFCVDAKGSNVKLLPTMADLTAVECPPGI